MIGKNTNGQFCQAMFEQAVGRISTYLFEFESRYLELHWSRQLIVNSSWLCGSKNVKVVKIIVLLIRFV